ncbi:MAG: CopD family protein [Flavobacteriales bacterium]|nr:CopD family protein [Flavobacteriales bacterium]
MYFYLKALHIIFVVSWFAGLFYMVRLFIYHTEAEAKVEQEKSILQAQFKVMEYRLWYIITWPAAILATVFGYWLVYEMNLWTQPWMMVKMGLTTLLWIYHLITHRIFLDYRQNRVNWTSRKLRMWNEVATLWLVSIVFVVVLKGTMDWIYGTIGFFAVGMLLMLGIRLYRRMNK